MEIGALAPYEAALRGSGELSVRTMDGRHIGMDVRRWLAPADACDAIVLDRCVGPVLDVGCGPGRFAAALRARGVPALGIDIAETPVAMTRARGVPAVRASVFDLLPGEGLWPTVLLMDDNLGIGGDPQRLLQRVTELLAPGGRLIAETHPAVEADEVMRARFVEHGVVVGPHFDWAQIGTPALRRYALRSGYTSAEEWTSPGGRSFVSLEWDPVRVRSNAARPR